MRHNTPTKNHNKMEVIDIHLSWMSEKITSGYGDTETTSERKSDAVRQQYLHENYVLNGNVELENKMIFVSAHFIVIRLETRHTAQYLATFRTHLTINYVFL